MVSVSPVRLSLGSVAFAAAGGKEGDVTAKQIVTVLFQYEGEDLKSELGKLYQQAGSDPSQFAQLLLEAEQKSGEIGGEKVRTFIASQPNTNPIRVAYEKAKSIGKPAVSPSAPAAPSASVASKGNVGNITVTITEMSESGASGMISGKLSGLSDPSKYVLLVVGRSDTFYLNHYPQAYAEINADGSFSKMGVYPATAHYLVVIERDKVPQEGKDYRSDTVWSPHGKPGVVKVLDIPKQ